MLRELLECPLEEQIAPRPGMVVKNRHTGRYAKVLYFKWQSGTASLVPVEYEDGTTENIPVTAFGRRFMKVNTDTDMDYTRQKAIQELDTKIVKVQKELSNVESGINGLESSLKELNKHSPVVQQMTLNITELEKERDILRKELSELRQKRSSYDLYQG